MSLNTTNYLLSKKEWDKAYEDLQVLRGGNRNLIPSFNDERWSIHSVNEFSEYELLLPKDTNTSASIIIDVKPNTDYTFTFNSDHARYYIYRGSTGVDFINTIPEGSDVYTFNTEEYTQIRLFINTWSARVDRPRRIWDLKLEQGEASPWTPAPEDIDAHPLVVQMAEVAYKNSKDSKIISELEDALITLGGN